MSDESGEDKVVPLGVSPPPETPRPPTPPSKLHAVATTGMAVCALIAVLTMLLFITINWTETTRRYVIVTAVLSGVGFLAFASAAVITAAGDTYAASKDRRDGA